MEIERYYALIENAILELGINPVECKGENAGQWNLKKGIATIWVDVFNIINEGLEYPHLQICSPIFKIPENEQTKSMLYEEMLKINDLLSGVAFTIFKDWIYIKVTKEAVGLEKNEALTLILKVSNFSDRYKKELSEKFSIPLE
jgi:hypothetical protein